MSTNSDRLAKAFLENERQFHLGFLPTEQSSPLTKGLQRDFEHATIDGVKCLQAVDHNVLDMLKRVLRSEPFHRMVATGLETIRHGGRIVFSGCGATGRLSILLESMWRKSCSQIGAVREFVNNVTSLMTGGDYALVKSVESFEDHLAFGRRQVQEIALGPLDILVAITEGGETSSVLGTLFEALDCGAKAFLLFNNPAELLAERLERSRKAIRDPRVCVLDLSCGPMALAGSTRMQATTSEQLVAGGALEMVMGALLQEPMRNYEEDFARLLAQLEKTNARQTVADYIDFEAELCRNHGLLTYFAGEYLLDIFTDTTERSPTFMLPPFRKYDDHDSPPPWAFVKNPARTTPEVWKDMLKRPLRCLGWTSQDYLAMKAPAQLVENPPEINAAELLKFQVGRENPQDRTTTGHDAAVLVRMDDGEMQIDRAFEKLEAPFAQRRIMTIGQNRAGADFFLPMALETGPLKLMKHLALKLTLNTISTGTMVALGRVAGNWMSWVAVSNKKLIDRAIRLLAELGNLSYEESCRMIFAAKEEIENDKNTPQNTPVVPFVLEKLGAQRQVF